MTDTINSHSQRMYNAQKNTLADLVTPAPAVKVKTPVTAAQAMAQTRENYAETISYLGSPAVDPLDDPRVKALVEALRKYACDCGYACEQLNGTCGDTARAALEAIASPSISALEQNK